MGEGDVFPQQFESFIQDMVHVLLIARYNQVGRVHNHLEMVGLHCIEERTSPGRCVNHISSFRFKGKHDTLFFGDV